MGYQKQRVPVISAAEGYERVAREYDRDLKDYDEIDQRIFLRALPVSMAGMTALDAGGGTGRWAVRLAKRGAAVTVLDPAPTMLALAKAKEKSVTTAMGTIEAIPFPDDTFDVTLCAFVLGYVEDAEAAIDELLRVTKPGGLLLVSHNPERKSPLHKTNNRDPFLLEVTFHRPEELTAAFEARSNDVETTEVRTKKTVLAGMVYVVRKD